jgi:hypothetical protein
MVGIPAAIANAVFHVTRKRIRELPITPDKSLEREVAQDSRHLVSNWRAHVCMAGGLRGAFTVSASQREAVREYIARQEEHHRKRTFQQEYVELPATKLCGI